MRSTGRRLPRAFQAKPIASVMGKAQRLNIVPDTCNDAINYGWIKL